MTARPRSFELLDAEFVGNIRSELEDCINGLEHQLLRLEVLKPKKRSSVASVSFIIHRKDGSVKSSVYCFARGEGGRIKITQAADVSDPQVVRHEGALWSNDPVARTVEAAVIECHRARFIPMEMDWGFHPQWINPAAP
jgi:hypothetical protein